MQSDPSSNNLRSQHERSPSSSAPNQGQKDGGSSDVSSGLGQQRGLQARPSLSSMPPGGRVGTSEFDIFNPVWREYLWALLGVTLLLLIGGGNNIYALSFSLLLPGVALILKPPVQGLGLWGDRLVLAFLAFLLLAFIPQFYWPDPEWRTTASEVFGLDLPASLSIWPIISFEAWISTLAGFAWLYAASSWRINNEGRNRFFFALCLVVSVLAVLVFWGNLLGVKYINADNFAEFTFFPNWNNVVNFLAVGGVAAFGYFLSGLLTARLMPVVGLLAFILSLIALVGGGAQTGVILFFVGLIICYALLWKSEDINNVVKYGTPLVFAFIGFLVLSFSRTADRVIDFFVSSDNGSEESLSLLAKDTFQMIKDAPLSGHGLGTFSAIFPQYREGSSSFLPAVDPGSDILLLMAETGVIGLVLFLGCIYFYVIRFRGVTIGPSGSYQIVALGSLIVFLLHGIVDASGHHPGAVYFAILLAACAVPQTKEKNPTLSPKAWRICGGVLVFLGILWGLSGVLGLPVHSVVAQSSYEEKIKESQSDHDYEVALSAADAWINLRPLDWRAYFQRARLRLSNSGEVEISASDFNRARFVEPVLGIVALDEGFAWIPHDVERALNAWREVFSRKLEDREGAYAKMEKAAANNPKLMNGLTLLSNRDLSFRADLLSKLSGEALMKEINRDLVTDPQLGQYTREQRTSVLKNWINAGDPQEAEAFLQQNEGSVVRPWWLWSLLRKKQANFEDAVKAIRGAVNPPMIPDTSTGDVPLERLERDFRIMSGDVMRGAALLKIYLEQKNYEKVKELTQTMASSQKQVPVYVSYWQAESYYQLGDHIESWYAYEKYLKALWVKE